MQTNNFGTAENSFLESSNLIDMVMTEARNGSPTSI
jgi:hypothetical protein